MQWSIDRSGPKKGTAFSGKEQFVAQGPHGVKMLALSRRR
jgi:hypothetical protein